MVASRENYCEGGDEGIRTHVQTYQSLLVRSFVRSFVLRPKLWSVVRDHDHRYVLFKQRRPLLLLLEKVPVIVVGVDDGPVRRQPAYDISISLRPSKRI
jgi:hypothetical protein